MRGLAVRWIILAAMAFGASQALAQTSSSGGSCPATGASTSNNVASAQAVIDKAQAGNGYVGPTQECASLVQSLDPDIGKTATWNKGASATSGGLAYGTPIATFSYDSSGNYVGQGNGTKYTPPGTGGVSGNSHTAIFLNSNPDGSIQVLEQWSGQPAMIDTLPPGNCERCAGSYSAVAGASPVFSDPGGAAQGGGDGTGSTPGQSGSTQTAANCPTPSGQQDASQSSSGEINPQVVAQKVVEILGGQCWSCQIYAAIARQAGSYISNSYSQLTNNGSESGWFALLAAGLFALVLVWKAMLIMATPATPDNLVNVQAWSDLFRFLARAGVATTLLFGAAAVTKWNTPTSVGSTDGQLNVVHDILLDGPILVGTSVGCKAMTVSLQAIGAPSAMSCAQTGGTWMDQHVSDATTILQAWHNIGVGGVAAGAYLVADAGQYIASAFTGSINRRVGTLLAGGYSAGQLLKVAVIGFSGLALMLTFLSFTFSFGLRYIDALLRAFVAMGLAPIFIILWVFDRTRPMALAAFKSIIFMAMVFVVSGIGYAFAVLIVRNGLQSAGLGTDMSASAVAAAGPAVLGGDTSSGTGSGFLAGLGLAMGGQTAKDIRWDVYFILLATWSLAIGMTSMAFSIAEKFTQFGRGGANFAMGRAASATGDTVDQGVESAKQQGGQVLRGAGRGVTGLVTR